LSLAPEVGQVVGILTNPDAPGKRGKQPIAPPVKVTALEAAPSVPVFQPEKLDLAAREAVAALEPDLLVCVAYGKIFGPKFLGLFAHGGINLHPSLLPKYRGPAPVQAALLAGEAVSGITVQRLGQQMDAGDILVQETREIAPEDRADELLDRWSLEGAGLLQSVVTDFFYQRLEARAQDETEATYCSLLTKKDSPIDWSRPAQGIHNQVRALVPWPLATTTLQDKTLSLWQTQVVFQGEHPIAEPGTLVAVDKQQGILVQTGKDLLQILALQPQYKKEMTWKEFIAGARDLLGVRLGGIPMEDKEPTPELLSSSLAVLTPDQVTSEPKKSTISLPNRFKKSNKTPFFRRIFPRSSDSPEQQYYKILLWSLVGAFFLLGIFSLATLMVALRGPETIVIPDLRNLEFVDAVEVLQERGLSPRVQQRFFSDPSLRGKVVEQSPDPGGLIRAGRSITLTVSRGAVIDQVGDFVGRPLDEVRQELLVLFATYRPLLQVEDRNISYVFDSSEPGTILQQDPPAGTELAGLTPLNLLVSRGPEVVSFPIPDFTRIDFRQAIQLLAARDQPFRFELEDPDSTEIAGIITEQSPEPGASIMQNTPVVLTVQPLRVVPRAQVFGLFERTLPRYAVPVEITTEFISPEGEREIIFQMDHPGGTLSFPYLLPVNSQIILSAFGSELLRYIVTREQS